MTSKPEWDLQGRKDWVDYLPVPLTVDHSVASTQSRKEWTPLSEIVVLSLACLRGCRCDNGPPTSQEHVAGEEKCLPTYLTYYLVGLNDHSTSRPLAPKKMPFWALTRIHHTTLETLILKLSWVESYIRFTCSPGSEVINNRSATPGLLAPTRRKNGSETWRLSSVTY